MQALRGLVQQVAQQTRSFFRVNIIIANFDRPAYTLRPNKQLPQGWHSLRSYVLVEHPQFAHIIDNKLMDMVSMLNLLPAANT